MFHLLNMFFSADPCEIKNGWLIYNAALNKHEQCPTFKMTAMSAPAKIEEDIGIYAFLIAP